jgi:hypothetical protein
MQAFSEIAPLILADSPVILESLNPLPGAGDDVQKAWIELEAHRASAAVGREEMFPVASTLPGQITIPSGSVLA